ncbi:hypothetical protein [Pseudoduganella violacea]|uniref:Uncharacterized protein n=1 Tax=Pseudoduganella violacea TaxID=1715466 RepID=A0A7W5BDK1_9BURK|nr:hypothetical protein [Pseudoduganella violacea]MBB3120963.1 hypothetical protein [Pseudoduganella violacea]
MKTIFRLVCIALAGYCLCAMPVSAHNQVIHQKMTDLSYQMMVFVQNSGLDQVEGNDPKWRAFLQRVKAAPDKYKTRSSQLGELKPPKWANCALEPVNWNTTLAGVPYPPSWDFNGNGGCGVDMKWALSLDGVGASNHIGTVLGLWAAMPDEENDNTHLWIRLTNAAWAGAVRNVIKDAAEETLTVILLPIVCFIDVLRGDSKHCGKHAKGWRIASIWWMKSTAGSQALVISAMAIGWGSGISSI